MKPSFGKRFKYWFDNTMSRGTPAMMAWLGIVSVIAVLGISSLIVFFDGSRPTSLGEGVKEIWKNTVNTFKLGSGAETRPVMVVLSILLAAAGIFFASTLIGLITSGVNKKIADLRKGRSQVLEHGHTVLLGWSDQVYPMIRELMEANSNQRRGCVAILADRDRTEMEDDIRKHLGKTGNTQVVCRTGSPMDPHDLDIVSPQTARSVMVLTPAGNAPDSQIAKTLLALTNSPTRGKERYHVVASVRDARNHEAAQLAGGPETLVVDADDISARLMVQTCRQSGLSVVYQDLLDFAGDEVYMSDEPAMAGRSYGNALMAYRTSSVIGIQRADDSIEINPPMESLINPGDKVIAISEDDDTVKVADDQVTINYDAISSAPARAQHAERFLMLGWNRRAGNIVRQLNNYVPPGSSLDIIADEPDAKHELEELRPGLKELSVNFELGDTDRRSALETFDIGSYDHVMVLCYETSDPQFSDCRALITLLHLRQMQVETGQKFSIVSEMTDDRNRKLAQVTKADDFIVSQQLISLLMVQLSENKHLFDVFDNLFSPEGSEIYLKPAEDYMVPGSQVDFYTVVEAAKGRGHTAIGYRLASEAQQGPNYGVHLNPDKSLPVTFGRGDKVIVVSDD